MISFYTSSVASKESFCKSEIEADGVERDSDWRLYVNLYNNEAEVQIYEFHDIGALKNISK